MRHEGFSLNRAAHESGTTAASVLKHVPRALRRSKGGRWVATKSDRYVRVLKLPGTTGPVIVHAHGSKEGQFASAYLASVGRWRKTHKSYELAPFHGKKVGGFELITSSRTLRALDDAGLLQLDTLYAALKDTL